MIGKLLLLFLASLKIYNWYLIFKQYTVLYSYWGFKAIVFVLFDVGLFLFLLHAFDFLFPGATWKEIIFGCAMIILFHIIYNMVYISLLRNKVEQ
jgi:hypothetical protein